MSSPIRPRSSLKSRERSGEGNDRKLSHVSFSGADESEGKRRSPSPDNRSSNKSRSPSPQRRSESPSRSGGKKMFSEEDFERKKDTTSGDKRKQLAAKMRGLTIEPKEWSRAELMDRLSRFAKFSQEKETKVCEVKVKEGMSMSIEEVKVINELFRRIGDINKVDFSYCGVTDDHMQLLINEGFKNLRHLKELYLVRNQLTTATATCIISHFGKLNRKLEVLDVRENSAMTYEDGYRLFTSLGPIQTLNGLAISTMKKDDNRSAEMDLSNRDIRIVEIGIICGLAMNITRIVSLNLSHNKVTAKGLHYLLDMVKKVERIHTLDLSHNPLTNEGLDTTAIERLSYFVQQHTQLTQIKLEGVVLEPEERITLSLQVNRSVAGTNEGLYFNKFLENLIMSKAKPKVKEEKQVWQTQSNEDELDVAFIKSNRIPICTLDVQEKGYSLQWMAPPKNHLI